MPKAKRIVKYELGGKLYDSEEAAEIGYLHQVLTEVLLKTQADGLSQSDVAIRLMKAFYISFTPGVQDAPSEKG